MSDSSLPPSTRRSRPLATAMTQPSMRAQRPSLPPSTRGRLRKLIEQVQINRDDPRREG